MPDTRDPGSVIAAAERAAADGDYASAERLLREAAGLQEATLGPLHPDLANTLNNLGVVCEITEKFDEAERSFRRASAIATAVLDPSHPFVATSRKNLEDFCAARGTAVDVPAPPTAVDIPAPPPVADVPTPPPSADVRPSSPQPKPDTVVVPPPAIAEEPPPRISKASSRSLPVGALIAAGLLVGFLAGILWLSRDKASKSTPSETPAALPAEGAGMSTEPKPIAPAPSNVPKETTANEVSPGRSGKPGRPAAAAGTLPAVAEVKLCRDIQTRGPASGDWRCDSPSRPVEPGRLLFYTRLKSPTDATVQHRWYRDDRLRKSVDLTIRANAGSGYRTFSRNTVGSGEWRIELRTRDGALLHEERFTVR